MILFRNQCFVGFFVCCVVWRHVLGSSDVIDEISIALGKCKYALPVNFFH